MANLLNILLALQTDTAFDRRAFAGIAAQAHAHGNTLLHIKNRSQGFQAAVDDHGIDGIILSSDFSWVVDEAIATRKPCVNIANYPAAQPRAPMVGTDDHAIGVMIAEHFLSRGFKHFACFMDVRISYFKPRCDAFSDAIKAAGFHCHVGPPDFPQPTQSEGNKWEDRAGTWMRSLPKPIAVMTPFDGYAREAVIACKTVGLRVPEDVSIIGVDNDEMLCMTVWPQLSSVATQGDRIGYQAMELLRRLLVPETRAPENPILIPPSEILIRGSSSETAVEDPEVAAAIHFIRSNAANPTRVGNVVDFVAVSRRTLERRFTQSLGRNIADEIRRAHVERAKKLLMETDLPLPEVARRSGLVRQQHLCRILKQETGQTPRELRSTYRLNG